MKSSLERPATQTQVNLQLATTDDVSDLVTLWTAVSEHLTSQYGEGFWSSRLTEHYALYAMRNSSVYVVRDQGRLVATLTLSTKKPWAIDKKYFAASKRPLYLTSMAVDPSDQRQGVGKLCIEEARKIAANWPSDALRLDAYDADAGAGGFYKKCGFQEVGRVVYRGAPLIYFEMLL